MSEGDVADELGSSDLGVPVQSRPSFMESVRIPFLLSIALQLVLAPLTSVAPDVAVWMQTSERTMAGAGLYQLTGFTYPPLYGYWCMALGGLSRLFGIAPSSLGGPYRQLPGFWQFGGSYLATNPLFTLAVKLPLIAGTVVTGYFIWRIVLNLDGYTPVNIGRAKLAFLFWSLSPLVLFVTAVHGQIDPLVSCAVAGSVLFALENRWVLAGIFVALGVGAKLSPMFLVPVLLGLALRPDAQRWRRVGAFIGGGVITGVLTLGPTFGPDFIRNVFTRTGTGGALGGLGPFGLLTLPVLNKVWIFTNDHLAQVGQLGLALTGLLSLVAGWWVWRKRQASVVITMSLAVLLVATLGTPVLNAQYLLWFYPFLAIAAGGVLVERTRWFQAAAIGMSLFAPLFTIVLFSPTGLFIPSASALGWPTSGSIQHEWWLLYQPHAASTFVPGLNKDRLGVLCTFAVCFAVLAIVIGIWSVERSSTEPKRTTQHEVGQRSRSIVAVVLGVVLAIELFGLYAPRLWSSPKVDASMRPISPTKALVSVATHGEARLHLIGFAADRQQTLDHVFVYNDPLRPYYNSSSASVLGTLQSLQATLGTKKVTFVDANQLKAVLTNKQSARKTVVVAVSGTLPDTVWGRGRTSSLNNWMGAGGTLVWAGGEPGYLSVSQGQLLAKGSNNAFSANVTKVSKHDLLPKSVMKVQDGWTTTDLRPSSPWYGALHLTFTQQAYPLSIAGIKANHGLVLGQVDRWKSTNIAFVPKGLGGILVFAGVNTADQVGADTVKLLRGQVLNAEGAPTQAVATSPPSSLLVEASKTTTSIRLIALSDNAESNWLHQEGWQWPTP